MWRPALAGLTSIILLALAVPASVGALRYQAAQAPAVQPQTIDISAERFTFTPSEVKTTAGTPLEFRLTSDDTDHGFRIVGTDINVSIPKRGRGTVSVKFTPEKPGRYTFECSHVCGAGHSFMRGVIVVRER